MSLTELATSTRTDLESMTVASLRVMARGQVKGYSTMKKEKLINALLSEGEKLRTVATSLNEIAAAKEIEKLSESLGEYCLTFFKRFKSIVESNIDIATGDTSKEIYPQISGLATALVSYLDSMSGEQAHGGLADSTKLRYRSEVVSVLKESIQAEQGSFLKPAMESAVKILNAALAQALKDKTDAKKTAYKQSIAERKESKTAIDVRPLIGFAESVLMNIETMQTSQWKLVSIALAIVTGRRMAEVHSTSTSFEMVDDNALMFTGQMKAKGAAADYYESNPSYEIPCLVYPALAVAGHDWLRDKGKLGADQRKTHNRVSRYLSETMKQLHRELDIPGEVDKFTYKSLRALYGAVAFERSNSDDEAAYLAKILGHGRGDLQSGGQRITDFLTPQSYNSDWKLKHD